MPKEVLRFPISRRALFGFKGGGFGKAAAQATCGCAWRGSVQPPAPCCGEGKPPWLGRGGCATGLGGAVGALPLPQVPTL